jgi:hypothetical protein
MHLSNLECITVETLMPFLVAFASFECITVETLMPFLVADASLESRMHYRGNIDALFGRRCIFRMHYTVETLMPFLVADASLESRISNALPWKN